MTQTFVGAQVYLPGEIANTTVTVADGVIVEIGGPVPVSYTHLTLPTTPYV